MKYEYMIRNMLKFDGIKDDAPYQPQFINELNRLGQDGWQLVSNHDYYSVIFKRQITRQ